MSRSRFLIIVSGASEDPGQTIQGLKAALKFLGRRYLLKCETITPINEKTMVATPWLKDSPQEGKSIEQDDSNA